MMCNPYDAEGLAGSRRGETVIAEDNDEALTELRSVHP